MAKKVKIVIKIQIEAGKATPAPPVGTALGPHGINIGDFCKQFNDQTKEMAGDVVPAVLTIYEDRSFDFVLKTSPTASLIKKMAGITKGSGEATKKKVGSLTKAQVRDIAEKKLSDLNTNNVEAAMKTIEGTARNMGVTIEK